MTRSQKDARSPLTSATASRGPVPVRPWGPVEQVVLAAGGSPEHLGAAVAAMGLEAAADVVADELVLRSDLPVTDVPCRFRLDLTFGSERAGRLLAIDHGVMTVERGRSERVMAALSFDVVDLLRSLFDPASAGTGGQRAVTWLSGARRPSRSRAMAAAVQAVLTACDGRAEDLGDLAVRFGSDKWAGSHWYTQHYQRHVAPLRGRPVRLLEIGIGGYEDEGSGGASLRMWQSYFPRGLVYGLDIFEKPGVYGPRIRALQGDQSDLEFLDALGRQLGPFDIVIDDGSHINDHVKASFAGLFPHVRPGGLYVVEDLQTAYWPGFGGNELDLVSADTSINMLKGLVDGLNHQERPQSENGPSFSDQHVVGLHFYHNLAFVEKGLNAESSLPAYFPRSYSGGAIGIGRTAGGETQEPAGR